MVPDKQPPMLDYVTKLMLLEVVKATVDQDIHAARWIEQTMTSFYYRWRELDELKK